VVIWSSEKVCVVPPEVYTVVGSVYTTVDEAGSHEGVEVGGNTTVVVTPPIVTTRGGGWMLDVSVKVAVVSPELIGIFQSKISIDTQTQAFRGLLGTYHAAGPAYLLAQYRSLFGMQYISKILVWSYLGGP
jgi:hypothetical protein